MKRFWMTSSSYLLCVLWIHAASLPAHARTESSSIEALVSNAPRRKRTWRERALLRAEKRIDTVSDISLHVLPSANMSLTTTSFANVACDEQSLKKFSEEQVFMDADECPMGWTPIAGTSCAPYTDNLSCLNLCKAAYCMLQGSMCDGGRSVCDPDLSIISSSWAGKCLLKEGRKCLFTPFNSTDGRKLCYKTRVKPTAWTIPLKLSPCGALGPSGPIAAQCDLEYRPWNVQVVGGFQFIQIPEDGVYRIEITGAEGGRHGHARGGYGAYAEGQFTLSKDTILLALVGQMGSGPSESRSPFGGGGGGGSFVLQVVPTDAVGYWLATVGKSVKLLIAAGGGAGAAPTQDTGQSDGGKDIFLGQATREAVGGGSGAGGGYLFNGTGQGNSTARSLLFGGRGGGDDTNYGGFGGGGRPELGAGGGGGYVGGGCVISSNSIRCEGGYSFGASDAKSGINAGGGRVSFQKIDALAQLTPGEPGSFEASLSTMFTSSSFVDFDFGCFERSKKSCPELAQVGNMYAGKGITLDARTIYNAKTVSPSFCAAAGFDGSLPYGSKRMTIKFDTSVTRVGFYYLGDSPDMFVRVVGHFGSAKSFKISNNADKKPDASRFFSVSGNGIESISIEGASYCIDDLRWEDETFFFTFDFAKLAPAVNSIKDETLSFVGSQDVKVRVSGFTMSDQSKTQFNGFVNNDLVNVAAKPMKVVVMNLYPLELYNYSYYGFQDADPQDSKTRWELFVNGIPRKNGTIQMCPYGKSRLPEGRWLPRCWPSAMGQARSLDNGTLVFAWARKGNGPIALSGLTIIPAEMHMVGRQHAEVVTYSVDETVPEGFRGSGWLDEKSTTVDTGIVVHGPFNSSFANAKLFGNMPPHDVIAVSMRLWIERDWHNNEATLGMGGYEAWRSSWNRSCQNKGCPVGWKAWNGRLSTYDETAVCQPCFLDLAFGGLHTTLGAQAVRIGATLTDGFPDSWAFSHMRMTVGRITDTITTERRDSDDVEFFRAGEFIERIFGNLPAHQLIRISFDYLSVGSWRDVDAVVLLDGIEIFRRQRKVPDSCFVGDAMAFPTWNAAPQTNNTSLGIRCLWQVETAIPHANSAARLVISSTASGEKQFFGYTNFILQLGKESHQCQPAHCPDLFALLDDGPHWCNGVCTVDACCKRKDVCHSLSCDYRSGIVLKPNKMGHQCRGDGGCSHSECCDTLGVCDQRVCGRSARFILSKSDFCDGPVCREDECCEPRALCSSVSCPEGQTSRPGAKLLACSSSKCETHECCVILGQCSSTSCSRAEGWSPKPTSKTCQSSVCTMEDCCQRLPTCGIYSCPRGFDLKRTLPSFCTSSRCQDQECCEKTQGKCPHDLKQMCGEGWLPLQWPAERCADVECKMHECCSPLGQCLDIVCPKDWQPTDDPMKFCKADPCTPTECCTPMFAGAEMEIDTNDK